MKSTQAMRDRIRELMSREQDDYDRAVECALDDLEELLRSERRSQPESRDELACKLAEIGEWSTWLEAADAILSKFDVRRK